MQSPRIQSTIEDLFNVGQEEIGRIRILALLWMPTDQLNDYIFEFRESLRTSLMRKAVETYKLIDYGIKIASRLPMSFSVRGLQLSRKHACAKQRYKQVHLPKGSQAAPYVQRVRRRGPWIKLSRWCSASSVVTPKWNARRTCDSDLFQSAWKSGDWLKRRDRKLSRNFWANSAYQRPPRAWPRMS